MQPSDRCKLTVPEKEREMELDEEGFLDELLALRRVTWDSYPVGTSELLLCDGGRLDCSQEIPSLVSPDYSELKKAMVGFKAEQ